MQPPLRSRAHSIRAPLAATPVIRWPTRLKELCGAVRTARNPAFDQEAFGSIWLLLHTSISAHLRIQAARLGRVSHEDFEDIAAEKSLDLLRKIDRDEWDPSSRTIAEIEGYVTMVARNGLIDKRREDRRRVAPKDENRPEWDVRDEQTAAWSRDAEPPDLLVERREYAGALRNCAQSLNPRGRLIWFFRVFAGMSTKEIAAHPEVLLKPGHVDVLLQRVRGSIKECMERKGHDPSEVPSGTFTELWVAFRGQGPVREGERR